MTEAAADRLWARLSEYGTWDEWNPYLTESNVESYDVPMVPVGAVRAVGPLGNPRTREQLVAVDDIARIISYVVAEPPIWRFPARRYRGTVRVIELTDRTGSVIEWSGTYDCDAADEASMNELLTGLYASFAAGLIKAVSAETG